MIYALDTNTISNLLRREGDVEYNFTQEIIMEAGNTYIVPPMVVFELKRWLLDNPSKVVSAYNREFDNFFSAMFDQSGLYVNVWEKAAQIYISLKQRGQLIGDMDILIAAYCIINDFTLVTRNVADFKRIDELKFVNWF